MSTIKSSDEHLTLNADGSSKDIKFQANGVEKASIDSSGNLTVSGNLTSLGIDDNADATAITIDSSENVIIGASSFDQGGFSGSATGINVHGVSPLVLCKETDTNIRGYIGVAGSDMYVITPDARNLYLGTNDAARIAIDPTGAVTMPNQPAFYVGSVASQLNIALDTSVTVVMTNEIFDLGSNFASNTFTAPVTGKYQLTANMRLDSIDSAANYYSLRIITSNRNHLSLVDPDYGADLSYAHFSLSVLADMDAGDTAYVAIIQAGGSAQSDIDGDTKYTNFSGYLVA